ncbi:MAG: sugar phosphate isomerase/epimerase family protein [Promethearchaeota archaeon]
MQKLGINRWWLFERIGLAVVIDKISSCGFNGLELDLTDPADYNINELKNMFNKYKVRPSGIAAVNTLKEEYDLCSLDEDIRKRAINDVKNCLSFAKEIGAPVVVILPGFKQEGNNELLFNNFIESLKELGELCEELNIRLCIENAHDRICEDSNDLLKVFKTIGDLSRYIGALFDTGHFLLSGEDLSDVAAKLGQYVYHLHIDNNGGKADDHALPTVGLLKERDFIKLFKILKAKNYKGWYSFEIRPKPNEAVSFILETCKKFYDNFVDHIFF